MMRERKNRLLFACLPFALGLGTAIQPATVQTLVFFFPSLLRDPQAAGSLNKEPLLPVRGPRQPQRWFFQLSSLKEK